MIHHLGGLAVIFQPVLFLIHWSKEPIEGTSALTFIHVRFGISIEFECLTSECPWLILIRFDTNLCSYKFKLSYSSDFNI